MTTADDIERILLEAGILTYMVRPPERPVPGNPDLIVMVEGIQSLAAMDVIEELIQAQPPRVPLQRAEGAQPGFIHVWVDDGDVS